MVKEKKEKYPEEKRCESSVWEQLASQSDTLMKKSQHLEDKLRCIIINLLGDDRKNCCGTEEKEVESKHIVGRIQRNLCEVEVSLDVISGLLDSFQIPTTKEQE